jgi:3-oxoacyl-[acyl-carrier-protein] synthase III
MNLLFRNRKISGLLTTVPANQRTFEEEMDQFDFPKARSLKLKHVMGYDRHRVVKGEVCASDLACFGLDRLFQQGKLARDGFDAMVVVTQSPDYLMPPTSFVIQGQLDLREDIFCLDINQGCAGFIVGLFQSFLMLDQPSISRVVLINVDVLSRKVSPKDRNSYPLIGDACSIAVIERSEEMSPMYANLKMDGRRREALMIPAGGFRLPASPETAVLESDGDHNYRSLDHLRMNGLGVFNFVQSEVPPMIRDLLRCANTSLQEVDYFLMHQPNLFMLQKIADALQISYEKMPSNVVEKYGNSSGVTIPLAIADNLRTQVVSQGLKCCLAGFGVGLTWASMLMQLGPLNFCDLIEYP